MLATAAAPTATALPPWPRKRKPWAEDAPPILIEWYQDRKAEGFAENTCSSYALDLKDLAGFLTVPLEDAAAADLRAYRRSLLSRNLAMSTCSRRISSVRTFYNWLRIRNELPFSPAQDLKPPRRPDHLHRWWTAKEVAQLRRAFKGDDPRTLRDRALIELGLIGLRLSEAVGLDVNRVLDLNNPGRAAIIVRRKGNKEQVLPLSPAAREALQAWLKVRPAKDTDAVFFRIPFQPSRPRLERRAVRKILSRYVLAAGLKLQRGQSFHLLRHTFGQRMADTGVSLAEAQAVLGHSNPKTTLVYYTVSNTQLRKTMSRLSY